MIRVLVQASVLLSAVHFAGAALAGDAILWSRYKADFVSGDGRVMDRHQGQISHSEGQGYGMLLSVRHDDRPAFNVIWHWTKNNLRVRADHLFAWKWGKRPDGDWRVIDENNATDGDIVIAYALLMAAEQWHEPELRAEALKIIQDIRTGLAVQWQGLSLLLPGQRGFNGEGGIIINPSYLVLPAFRAFARVDDGPFWSAVHRDGLALIDRSCFGTLCLPADWQLLSEGGMTVRTGREPLFGSDAIRILLHLCSEQRPQFPKGVGALMDLYPRLGYFPLWVDLEKDSVSLQPAPAGHYAVYALAAGKRGDARLSSRIMAEARKKLKAEGDDYYSASLYLLAHSEPGTAAAGAQDRKPK